MRAGNAEGRLQAQVCQLLRLQAAPDVLWWHPNNNPRSARDGARLKKMGMKPGVSDLHFLHEGRFFSLELKTERGRPTIEQLAWKDAVNKCEGFAAIAYGYEAALKALRAWGLVR